MSPRQSSSSQAAVLEKFTGKLDAFIAVMEEHADQTDESIGEMTQIVKDLVDEVRILRIAIDDIRCEIEWTMRNHAPPRPPAIGLPVVSVPKVAPMIGDDKNSRPNQEERTGHEGADEPGRLF